MIETPVKNVVRTLCLLFLAIAIAFFIWYMCMKQLGIWLLEVDALNDEHLKLPRLWINIIVYSIAVIFFNKVFKSVARDIVIAENKKYNKDHEESLIQKSFTLGFVNSYLGMCWASFVDNKLTSVCGLLLSVLMLKQIIMNTYDLFRPQCREPKRFLAHMKKM